MGVSYHVYVGPYIKVYNPDRPAKEEIHSCSNPKCDQYENPLSSKFCPSCGTEVKLVEVPCTQRVDMWELLSDMNDTLSEVCTEYKPDELEDYSILVPNKKAPFARHFEAYDSQVVQMDWATVQKEEEAFWKKYEKELETLNEKFDDENVTTLWGVVAYAC